MKRVFFLAEKENHKTIRMLEAFNVNCKLNHIKCGIAEVERREKLCVSWYNVWRWCSVTAGRSRESGDGTEERRSWGKIQPDQQKAKCYESLGGSNILDGICCFYFMSCHCDIHTHFFPRLLTTIFLLYILYLIVRGKISLCYVYTDAKKRRQWTRDGKLIPWNIILGKVMLEQLSSPSIRCGLRIHCLNVWWIKFIWMMKMGYQFE